jgi:hypothetical protein
MPLSDWIERYPQVKALLQGEGEALLYGVEPMEEAPSSCQDAAAGAGPEQDPARMMPPETQARLARLEAAATALAVKRALAVAMAREIRRRFQPRDEDTHA